MCRFGNTLLGRATARWLFAAAVACVGTVARPVAAQQPEVGFAASAYYVAENGGQAVITLVRGVSLYGPASVSYSLTDGTATNGINYLGLNGTVIFDNGESETNFVVQILDDGIVNGDLTLNLTLYNPSAGIILTTTNAVLTILETDGATAAQAGSLTFTASRYYVTEFESSQPPPGEDKGDVKGALITVTRQRGSTGRILVDYATTNTVSGTNDQITAVPNRDYSPVQGTLVFDDYQMSAQFLIRILGATGGTSNGFPYKEITVLLSNPRPAPEEDPAVVAPTLGVINRTTVQITRCWSLPARGFSFERATYRVPEDGGNVICAVVLPEGGPADVLVYMLRPAGLINAAIQAGSRRTIWEDEHDFDPPTVALHFPAPGSPGAFRQTFALTITNDTEVEFNEDIIMQLVNPSPSPYTIGFQGSATATIEFDDQPAGALDREWNPDGVVYQIPPYNPHPGANDVVQAVAVQDSDGKTVIGGQFTAYNTIRRYRVARINLNGFIDTSFDPGTGANGAVNSVLIYRTNSLNAGKILIGGAFSSFNGTTRYGVARLNPNGSLDNTFNPGNGVVSNILGMAFQADERIIIVGDFSEINGVAVQGIARLNADGSLDTAFLPTADGVVSAVAVDGSQRIVVGGSFLTINGAFRSGVARLNPDGTLDNNFDPGGGADNPVVYAVAVQSDNKVLFGGAFGNVDFRPRAGIARLNVDGSLDTSFDTGIGFDDAVYSIVVQPDGGILVGGIFAQINYTRRIGLARLYTDGTVDTTFMDAAYNQFAGVINDFSFEQKNYINAIALQADGNVIVGGSFRQMGGNLAVWFGSVNFRRDYKRQRNNVARLIGGATPGPGNVGFAYPTYTVDENAGTLPVTIQRMNGGLGSLVALAATSNNVATAGVNYSNTVSTVNGDNGRYSSFVIPIINENVVEGDHSLFVHMQQPVSSLSLGAGLGETIGINGALHRSDATVTIVDDDFYPGRFVFSSPVYSLIESGVVATITVQRIGGLSGSVSVDYFTQLGTALSSGTLQDYIPTNGTVRFAAGESTKTFSVRIIQDSRVEPDETIFLGLTNATGGALVDYSSVDPSFITGFGANDRVRVIAVHTNFLSRGKIVVAGDFTSFNGQNHQRIARLNPDGSIDPGFPLTLDANDSVEAVTIQGDGRILLSGAFTSINGAPRNRIARLNENGTLDTTFDVGPGGPDPGSNIRAIAVQTNSSVLVGGDFLTFSGRDNPYLVRLPTNLVAVTTNGINTIYVVVPDSSFQVSLDGPVYSIVVQPDNRILIGGDFTTVNNRTRYGLARLNTNGTVDLSFTPATVAGAHVRSLALLNDGRIMVGGENAIFSGASPYLRRLNPSGTIDTTFAPSSGPNGPVYSVSVHLQGSYTNKVVIGGAFTTVNGQPRAYVARINQDGILDPSFAPTPAPNGWVLDTAIQSDNKLLIGGEFTLVNGLFQNHLARISPSMATLTIIDDDLSSGKATFTSLGYTTNENAGAAIIAVQRTGGSVGIASVQVVSSNGTATAWTDYIPITNTVTWSSGDTAVKYVTVPLLDDGLVEPTEFLYLYLVNPTNIALGNIPMAVLSIENSDFPGSLSFSLANFTVMENSGQAVITVTRHGGVSGPASVRFAATAGTATNGVNFTATNGVLNFSDGESSKSFNVVIIDNTQPNDNLTVLLTLSNVTNATLGPIFSATLTIVDDETFNLPAGGPDATFDVPAGANDSVYAVAVQTDGSILMAGDFTQVNNFSRNRVARLFNLGALDGSFNQGAGPDGPVRAMVLQDDGKILIGGFFGSVGGINRNRIARLYHDGLVDDSFDPGGGADNTVYAIALAPDGKVVIGGAFTRVNGVLRPNIAVLNTNGMVNTAFNAGAGPNDTVFAVALQDDGKILIGGDFTAVNNTNRSHLARLNRDGSLDPTFTIGTGFDAAVRAIQLQSDGRILVGGSFLTANGTNRHFLARLNKDGSLDTNFLAGVSGANNPVYALALQADEKILVAGDFTRFNGVTRNRITRLNQDGTTDTTINFGTGANAFIAALAIQSDTRILIGGGFTEVNGQSMVRIARLYGGSMPGPGQLEFIAANFDVNEWATNAVVTVHRVGGTTGTVNIHQTSSAGTAIAGVNYQDQTNTLVFPPGEVVQSFTIPIVDDNLAEPPLTVNLALDTPTGGATLGPQYVATVTIVNDDSVISFDRLSYREPENTPSGRATLTLLRTYATNCAVSVSFSTTTNFPVTTVLPAVEGVDYIPTNGTVTFAVGETSKNIFVPIINQSATNGNRMLSVVLGNPVALPPSKNASLGAIPQALLTIVDTGFFPGVLNFSQPGYLVLENETNVVIAVRRDNGSSGIVSVDYTMGGGTATPGIDYEQASGTLAFADGQNLNYFVIPLHNDMKLETTETIILTLANPHGGATLGTNAQVTLTILNNGGVADPGNLLPGFDPGLGADNLIRTLAVQTDGRLIIGGAFTQFGGVARNHIARVNTDATLDTSFDTGTGTDGFVSSVALQPDGKVLLGGSFLNVNQTNRIRIARLNTDGSLDSGFAPAGVNASVYAVVPHQGGVLLGGSFSDAFSSGVTRYLDDGTPDFAFNSGLFVNGSVFALAVQPDYKVIMAGDFTSVRGANSSRVARLNADGSLDSSFVVSQITTGTVYSVALMTNGQMVIGGEFLAAIGTNTLINVARLNANGTLDPTLAPLVHGADDTVFSVAVQPDGKVLLGGDFTHYDGVPCNRIARLNASGSLDFTFAVAGANSTVYTVVLQRDQRVNIGGDFTVFNGQSRNGLAQLMGGDPFNFAGLKFLSIETLADGPVEIIIASQPGHVYAIDYTANFVTWRPLATNTAAGAIDIFYDTPAPGQRIYRARLVGP